VEIGAHAPAALRHLLDIYQQEKEWGKAILAAKRLQEVNCEPLGKVIAHYYCELAEQCREAGDPKGAADMLGHALSYDRKCVRASLIEGGLYTETGDVESAIRAYRRVEEQDIAFIGEAIDPLEEAYQRAGRPQEMTEYLRHVLESYSGITPALALAERIRQQSGDRQAVGFIAEHVRRRPSLRGLARLIELSLEHADGDARENLLILQDLVRGLLEQKPTYRCQQCGLTGKVLYWHCPSCKSWNTVKPVQGVEGE
jgi:lipopolysaccharide assembly protein B